jgi:hypothetical protein
VEGRKKESMINRNNEGQLGRSHEREKINNERKKQRKDKKYIYDK